jgi:5-methylcytosine-specific restriction endonuclease McrA
MEKYRLQSELGQVIVQSIAPSKASASRLSSSASSASSATSGISTPEFSPRPYLSPGPLPSSVPYQNSAESARSLSDDQLIERLRGHVLEERRVVTSILEYLREVDRRRLYAEAGYPSLWDFCIRELGYSEGAASRRINSMRLLRDLPELKKDIEEGKHNLSSLAQAQKFFRIEEKHHSKKMSSDQKMEVLHKLENKTSLECEKELIQLSSVPLQISRPQTERLLDEKHVELKLVINQKLLLKLKRVQALRSHASPSMNYAELLEFMADEILKRFDPAEKAKSALSKSISPKSASSKPVGPKTEKDLPGEPPVSTKSAADLMNEAPAWGERVAIPETIRRSVWLREEGKCGHRDPRTGRVCGSRHFLEIDHIRPVSRGGGNEPSNLRLRCRGHNQRYAFQMNTRPETQPSTQSDIHADSRTKYPSK